MLACMESDRAEVAACHVRHFDAEGCEFAHTGGEHTFATRFAAWRGEAVDERDASTAAGEVDSSRSTGRTSADDNDIGDWHSDIIVDGPSCGMDRGQR